MLLLSSSASRRRQQRRRVTGDPNAPFRRLRHQPARTREGKRSVCLSPAVTSVAPRPGEFPTYHDLSKGGGESKGEGWSAACADELRRERGAERVRRQTHAFDGLHA
jgi:hypothetical protein